MKVIFSIFLFFTFNLMASENLLRLIDDYRNPSESYSMIVTIKSTKEKEDSKFEVLLKGNNKTLIKVLAPKKNLKRNMLMIDQNMWVYIPNIKRAVRVSLNQKLTGEAANGDIARMRWDGDYKYKIVDQDNKIITLYLEALKNDLTYSKLKVYVEAKTYKPIKAEFLSLSDKILKVAEYTNYEMVLGRERPMKMIITDYLQKDKSSELYFSNLKIQNFPDSLFQEKSLE